MGEAVADAAVRLYEQLGHVLGDLEFTVLAAIVVERNDEFKVLSLATGTKCCGEGEYKEKKAQGTIIRDSHAEVLARRAFNSYLMDCISALMDAHASPPGALASDKATAAAAAETIILEVVNGKVQMKKDCKLHIYISDSPCGDACIYERSGTAGGGFTGAKRARRADDGTILKEADDQEVGILRTKSGRSDLPERLRTASMSCSDKICRWLCLGLQGSLLAPFFTSAQCVPLAQIVIGNDPLAAAGAQHIALERAIGSRVSHLQVGAGAHIQSSITTSRRSCCSVALVVLGAAAPAFAKGKCNVQAAATAASADSCTTTGGAVDHEHSSGSGSGGGYNYPPDGGSRDSGGGGGGGAGSGKRKRGSRGDKQQQPRPSGSSINWIRNVHLSSSSSSSSKQQQQQQQKQKAKTKTIEGGSLEVTQAQSGSLLGASKAMVGTFAACSRLCSRKLSMKVAMLVKKAQQQPSSSCSSSNSSSVISLDLQTKVGGGGGGGASEECTYAWWKGVDHGYAERRRCFLEEPCFRDWIVNPAPLVFPLGSEQL